MKTQLLKCVEALKDARDVIHNNADPRTADALDQAIAEIEACMMNSDLSPQDSKEAVLKAIEAICNIVNTLEGIASLIRTLWP